MLRRLIALLVALAGSLVIVFVTVMGDALPLNLRNDRRVQYAPARHSR